jgi:hypothetical protein
VLSVQPLFTRPCVCIPIFWWVAFTISKPSCFQQCKIMLVGKQTVGHWIQKGPHWTGNFHLENVSSLFLLLAGTSVSDLDSNIWRQCYNYLDFKFALYIIVSLFVFQLSAYVLHTLPVHWPNAVPELLATLQPSNLPSIPPERTAWILLEILTVLPEEVRAIYVLWMKLLL